VLLVLPFISTCGGRGGGGTVAAPASGSLDSLFGTAGKVTTDLGSTGDRASALVLQPNGKLVAAGSANGDFTLARYNTDGSLDTSFGAAGKVATDFGSTSDQAFALVLQPDGKLVAAGSANGDFALARYNADGSLDPSFGTGGKVTTDFGTTGDTALALVLQPDGKLVAAGSTSNFDCVLARYNADGSLDTNFGTGGKVTTTGFGASALILQPDGKLVAAGDLFTVATNDNFGLARYNSDGSLDSTFGAGGEVLTDFGGEEFATALVLQPDGKFVVAGVSSSGPDFALARYNTDGSLDTSFGSGGKVITAGFGSAAALVLQPDGKLVAAGDGFLPLATNDDFGLVRYNPDGSLDTGFGAGGKVLTDFGGANDAATSLVLQPDGKIVAAGISGGDFALARYFP